MIVGGRTALDDGGGKSVRDGMRSSKESDAAWGALLLAVLVIIAAIMFSRPVADAPSSDMTTCRLCDGVPLF